LIIKITNDNKKGLKKDCFVHFFFKFSSICFAKTKYGNEKCLNSGIFFIVKNDYSSQKRLFTKVQPAIILKTQGEFT